MVNQKKYAEIGTVGSNIGVCPQTIEIKTISGLKMKKNKEILILSNLIVKTETIRIAKKFEICKNILLVKTFDRRFILLKTTDTCSNSRFSISAEPIGEKKIFFDNNKIAMLLNNSKKNYKTFSFSTNKEKVLIELFCVNNINFVSCQYA